MNTIERIAKHKQDIIDDPELGYDIVALEAKKAAGTGPHEFKAALADVIALVKRTIDDTIKADWFKDNKVPMLLWDNIRCQDGTIYTDAGTKGGGE